MTELPQNAGVVTFPVTDEGNDPADWSGDPRTVGVFKARVSEAIETVKKPENPLAAKSAEEAEAIGDPVGTDEGAEIERLTMKAAAKGLGVPLPALRKLVKQQNKTEEESIVEVLEPWNEPIDCVALANEVRSELNRYIFLDGGEDVPIALWVMGTYIINAFRIFPKLHIHSPEKRCGKSTLLEFLEGYCNRTVLTASITPAALFRMVDECQPTLMIDEVDAFLAGNDELRGVINSGHTRRTAFVIRTQGDDHKPTKFSTWTPMILAGIGRIPDTIADRSVVVRMQRATGKEKRERLLGQHYERTLTTRRKLCRWALDNEGLIAQKGIMPPEIENSRAMDNWIPLFAVADAIGGEWPELCKAAYVRIHTIEESEDDSITTMLLTDIKQIFDEQDGDRMFSAELVAALAAMEDRPWETWSRGKPMTTNALSGRLKEFKIKPADIRIGDVNKKGYLLEKFKDAFKRYVQTATTRQASDDAGCGQFQTATIGKGVALENPLQPSNDAGCHGVAFQTEGKEESAPQSEEMEL